MGKHEKDPELLAYKNRIGSEEYNRQYHQLYDEAKQKKSRYSGQVYDNSPDKLKALREKYKNGVSDKTIREMLSTLRG